LQLDPPRQEVDMLGAKWLIGLVALVSGAWELWSEPRWLGVVLEVAGAVLVSWLLFVCIFYLTASHVRRSTQRTLHRAHMIGIRTNH
jgi:hypothetical protein